MFEILFQREQSSVLITNKNGHSHARINLKLGGSLEKLTLNRIPLIIDLLPNSYGHTYASSILFPFTGRIKDARYQYNSIDYQLTINDSHSQSAIHGLIYNKKFEVKDFEAQSDKAYLRLSYSDENKVTGFPYRFAVELVYTLTLNSLDLEVIVKNLDNTAFPYSIGWHPYFVCSDRKSCFFKSPYSAKAIFDDRMILKQFDSDSRGELIKIGMNFFDDCYELRGNSFQFHSPEYILNFNLSSNTQFLHIYTPRDDDNIIAIEPTTAPPDSFNNKLGLGVLESHNSEKVKWTVELIS